MKPSRAWTVVLLIVVGCSSDTERQNEIQAAATAAAEAAYAKGKAEAEQAAAARAQQEAAQQAAAAEQAAQEQAAAEQLTRDAVQKEKNALRRNPTRFLVVSDTKAFDRGFINSYRQLMHMTVLNRSKYAVTSLAGEVDWSDADGAKIGSTTFSISGSLPAGDTKTFTTSNGTLTSSTLAGNAKTHVVRFTQVELVE